MTALNNKSAKWSDQPGPISWKSVPDFIQHTLIDQDCSLLKHDREQPQLKHIRFQYTPLLYKDHLYYLQRWSDHEWGVSPSQIIFPTEGTCSFEVLSNGNLLSLLVKKAVTRFYGHFPDNSPLQPFSSTSQYTNGKMLPLAG